MKEYIDYGLQKDAWIIKKVADESCSQINKWGIQVRTSFEWLAYLTEEVGELANAISEYEYRNGTHEEVTKEAVQVATLALKIAEMFEHEI